MGYSFTIGKKVQEQDHGETYWTARPASKDVDDPSNVWGDEFEVPPYSGGASRPISYGAWEDVLETLPALGRCFEMMEHHVKHEGLGVEGIPVAFYEDILDEIESDAERMLSDAPRASKAVAEKDALDNDVLQNHTTEQTAASVRALWFVRWSRKAGELYGDEAVFDTPGEWY